MEFMAKQVEGGIGSSTSAGRVRWSQTSRFPTASVAEIAKVQRPRSSRNRFDKVRGRRDDAPERPIVWP
jgi:hypothetical protein